MQSVRTPILLGKYAIRFRSLSDAIAERRRVFFGNGVKFPTSLDSTHTSDEPQAASESEARPYKPKGLEKLEDAVEKAQKILIKSSAVFPFDLFPDSITVDRQKLTVVHRNFFTIKQTVSVQYCDIKNIQADTGPFLGSLTVTSEHFVNNTQTIKYLPRKEALAIQQLVQGFIIANNEEVDMSDIADEKLVELLSELGRGEAGKKPVLLR